MRIYARIDKDKLWNFTIFAILIVAFYYLSYRYFLQINSSTTSPTYTDTPPVFQYGKYVLIAAVIYLFVMGIMMLKNSVSLYKKNIMDLSMSIFLFAMPVFSFFLMNDPYLVQVGLFFGILILYYVAPFENINLAKFDKYVMWFIYLAIIIEAYQLYNFFVNDRLPAMGYYNSISVRFGSLWDDPNGFALFIPFLFCFVYFRQMSRFKKFLLLTTLLGMLVLTQSLTGIAAFALAIPIGLLFLALVSKLKRFWKLFGLVFVLYGIAASLFFELVYPSAFFQHFLHLKQGSIDDHAEGLDVFGNIGLTDLLGLNPKGWIAETGYINLFLNFGIVYGLLFIIIGFSAIIRLSKIIKDNRNKKGVELYIGFYFFIVSFYIAMANLPLETVFPLSLILVIGIIMSHMDKPIIDSEEKIKRKKKKRLRITW